MRHPVDARRPTAHIDPADDPIVAIVRRHDAAVGTVAELERKLDAAKAELADTKKALAEALGLRRGDVSPRESRPDYLTDGRLPIRWRIAGHLSENPTLDYRRVADALWPDANLDAATATNRVNSHLTSLKADGVVSKGEGRATFVVDRDKLRAGLAAAYEEGTT